MKEQRLENISLSIPFLVLSSERTLAGEMAEHLLTPFGFIDLRFPGSPRSGGQVKAMEIEVFGDIDSWMVQDEMPREFKCALLEFVLKIASSRWSEKGTAPHMLSVSFKGIRFEVNLQENCRREDREENAGLP